MLQLDPTRRPRDAGEVLRELEAIGERLRAAATEPPEAPAARR